MMGRTDSGESVMQALEGRIALYTEGATERVELTGMAIDARLERAAISGALEDYAAADQLSQRWLARAPQSGAAILARARVAMVLHRFSEAAALMARAEAAKVAPGELSELRLGLLEARGDDEAVLQGRQRIANAAPSLSTLGRYAMALAERDRFDDALAVMPRALATYRDVAPGPLAWLLFQWGRIAEAAGLRGDARDLYRLAVQRMPMYGEAARHFAALAADQDGLAALRASTDHPETTAMLAARAAKVGATNAAALRARATEQWEAYLAGYPEAFAEHAAHYYLTVGANPQRALDLAELNLANRSTVAARTLLIDAALAAGNLERACGLALGVKGDAPKRLRFSTWRAFGACGKNGEAERLGKELGIMDHGGHHP